MIGSVRVAILGASGYGASELLRLCAHHPAVEVVSVISRSQNGVRIDSIHPHLRGFYTLSTTSNVDQGALLGADHAVIFSALPHGVRASKIDSLLSDFQGSGTVDRVRVIDLSGDLRLKDIEVSRRYYPETPALPQHRSSFVLGMPEICRKRITGTRLVANPGCLAYAAILAAAPLVRDEFSGWLVFDAKTGSSGSGIQLKRTTHHPLRHANFSAYKPLAHQHEPEILQALGDIRGKRIQASFVAQSMDVARGIFITLHLMLPEPSDADSIRRIYAEFYDGCPFIRIVDVTPELQNVVGSNFCDIAVACRERQVIVMAALDNLTKGMAGTAIQNMNLMCGLPETTGLWAPSFRPI